MIFGQEGILEGEAHNTCWTLFHINFCSLLYLLMSMSSGLKKNVVVVLRTVTVSAEVQKLEKLLMGESIIFI